MIILKILNNIENLQRSELDLENITHCVIKINNIDLCIIKQLYYLKCKKRNVKIICDIDNVRDIKEIVKFCIKYGMDGCLIKNIEENDKEFVHNFCNIISNLPYPYNYKWEIIVDGINNTELLYVYNNKLDIIKKNTINLSLGYICIEWSKNIHNILKKYRFDVESVILCNKENTVMYPSSEFISSLEYDKNDEITNIIKEYL